MIPALEDEVATIPAPPLQSASSLLHERGVHTRVHGQAAGVGSPATIAASFAISPMAFLAGLVELAFRRSFVPATGWSAPAGNEVVVTVLEVVATVVVLVLVDVVVLARVVVVGGVDVDVLVVVAVEDGVEL